MIFEIKLSIHSPQEFSLKVAVPLTSNEIVEELVRFAGIDREESGFRVAREIEQLGWNVNSVLEKFAVTPHVYNSAMEKLYKEGSSSPHQGNYQGCIPEKIVNKYQALFGQV